MINPRSCVMLGLMLLIPACAGQSQIDQAAAQKRSEDQLTEQRRNLVNQLRSEGVSSKPVLDALLKVPRHKFVPPSYQHLAYENRPLPIGHEQTISQPYIVAYMTEAAEIGPGEKVLEIGTGSGYQAAVLAELAKEVFTIEIIAPLADSARKLLEQMGYSNVRVKTGNGYEGWPQHAPFDAIVVTAAPDQVPKALVDQLAVKGKMVIPVGTAFQEMVIIDKGETGVVERRTIPVRFVPMTGKPTP